VAVGKGQPTMDPWRQRDRGGGLNREIGGIWQPALVRPRRPATGRVGEGAESMAATDGSSRVGGVLRTGSVPEKENIKEEIKSFFPT
jgi:hypothetical protein